MQISNCLSNTRQSIACPWYFRDPREFFSHFELKCYFHNLLVTAYLNTQLFLKILNSLSSIWVCFSLPSYLSSSVAVNSQSDVFSPLLCFKLLVNSLRIRQRNRFLLFGEVWLHISCSVAPMSLFRFLKPVSARNLVFPVWHVFI